MQNGPQYYEAASISVLSGIESIRLRPAMYVGSTGRDGLHHLLCEVVQNAIDEVITGHCSEVQVTLHTDGACSVEDDGRGIPTDPHPLDGRPACEVVLTTLHAGGKFTRRSYHRSGGLHGIGLTCVNALSESLELDVWRDGSHVRQRFSRGNACGPPEVVGPSDRRGTRVRFLPDPSIFQDTREFSLELAAARLRDLSFLHPRVCIRIDDERTGQQQEHRNGRGIAGLAEERNLHRKPVHPHPILLRGCREGVDVEVALQWTTSTTEDLCSFANSVRTRHGGFHVEGLWKGIAGSLSDFARRAGLLGTGNGDRFGHLDVREGLTAVLAVSLDAPEFEGQTKGELANAAVAPIVESIVSQGLRDFLADHRSVGLSIVGRIVEASRVRALARRTAERARFREFDPAASRRIYQQQFGARSRNWHESCAWLTDDELLEQHAKMCRVDESSRLLDVCCGSGVVGAAFAPRVARTVGLDITHEMRELAKTRLDEVWEGSVYQMPFEDASFDIVVTREVLHLLPHPERALAEIRRVLRPGGQIVFGQTVPYGAADAAWMFRIFKKKQPLFFNNLFAEDYIDLLREVGFEQVEMAEHFLWESIDVWTDSYETSGFHRYEIKRIYAEAPLAVREIHPFEIRADGEVFDRWRWCIYSARNGASPRSPDGTAGGVPRSATRKGRAQRSRRAS